MKNIFRKTIIITVIIFSVLFNLKAQTLREIMNNPDLNYYEIQEQSKGVVIQVSDMKGTVIQEIKLNKTTNQSKISTALLKKGVYSVSILSNKKLIDTVKLIVE